MQKHFKKANGFTLIELLIVIAVIGALTATVFAALNPAKRLADARDARRYSDVDTVLTAVHAYIVDNKGTLPTGMSAGMAERQLGTGASCTISTGGCNVTTAACLDLSTVLAAYLKNIPTDPKTGTSVTTNYSIVADSNGLVTVKACGAENVSSIAASR